MNVAAFFVTATMPAGPFRFSYQAPVSGAGSRNEEEACRVARKAAHTYIDAEIAN